MDLTIIVSITFAIFPMNWQLGLIAYATLPVYVVLQKRVSERMRQKARKARRRMDIVEGNLHKAIAGIAEVKSFTHEQQEVDRFVTGSLGFLAAVSGNIRTYALLLGSTTWLTRLTLVIVIWAGGHLVLRNTLTVGGLMAFYAYLEMPYAPLNRLGELNIELANSRAAIDGCLNFSI
jgi:ABC-type multidrug transport system fused ATPase/permease subunit